MMGQPRPRRTWLTTIIETITGLTVMLVVLVFITLLTVEEVQTAQVMWWGIPTHGTVVALTPCGGGKSSPGTIAHVRFSDALGHTHLAWHTGLRCAYDYHVGDDIAIRYFRGDPQIIRTQADMNGFLFWFALWGLFDLGLVSLEVFWIIDWIVRPNFWPIVAPAQPAMATSRLRTSATPPRPGRSRRARRRQARR